MSQFQSRLLSTGLSLLLGSYAAHSFAVPEEHSINRSIAAQGAATNILWSSFNSASKVQCGTACRYWQRSAGRLTPPSNWSRLPAAWPNSSSTSFPAPALLSLIQLAPTNETTWDDALIIYDTSYLQKSAVTYTNADKSMRASVQKSGNVASALAYHVRVQNQSAATRDYFVRFKAPVQKNSLQAAYEVGGPSGNQPVPVGDNEGVARSSVELLIDGLPVWQTARSLHRKDLVANAYGTSYNWGEDASDDSYTIYVGRYSSGATFMMDYIMQADVLANAPDCGQDFNGYLDNSYSRHCQVLSAGREIPNVSFGGAAFEIISTASLSANLSLDIGGVLNARAGGN
ncbi:MAG TPA: hypothetical protein VL995_00895 [Cellvibrio sp.]|nr:hypothetical protein [Cellvibrio sp.]